MPSSTSDSTSAVSVTGCHLRRVGVHGVQLTSPRAFVVDHLPPQWPQRRNAERDGAVAPSQVHRRVAEQDHRRPQRDPLDALRRLCQRQKQGAPQDVPGVERGAGEGDEQVRPTQEGHRLLPCLDDREHQDAGDRDREADRTGETNRGVLARVELEVVENQLYALPDDRGRGDRDDEARYVHRVDPPEAEPAGEGDSAEPVSYTHLTLPTNREV